MTTKLRNLENYKSQHKETARKKGLEKELANCRTLTAARKILFGEKQKVISCSGCGHRPDDCAGTKTGCVGGRRR